MVWSYREWETNSFPNSVEGKKLAQMIQRQIINKRLYTSIRGIKTARFFVLRKTKMTSALTEMAFITNPEDAKLLRNKQNEFAEAIAIGILNYLGITYKVKKQENKKPSSGGLYKVQVGAFSNKKNAENLVNEILDAIELWEDRVVIDRKNTRMKYYSGDNVLEISIPYFIPRKQVTSVFNKKIAI